MYLLFYTFTTTTATAKKQERYSTKLHNTTPRYATP